MNSAPKNLSRADRLLATAQEPNLSSWGWPAVEELDRHAKVIRTTSLVGALSLGLMLWLAFNSAYTLPALLCGLGAGLMVAICIAARSE